MTKRSLGLPVLALCAFVFVSCELFPLSALLSISTDLHVSEADAGLLLSGYAVVVAITVAPIIRWTRAWDRRTALAATMVVLALSSVASAGAHTYVELMACRLVMALGHGLFWAGIASTAARLAPDGGRGRATAAVFSGNALALIVGVPALNACAGVIGWRGAAAASGVAALVATVLLVSALPPLPALSTGVGPAGVGPAGAGSRGGRKAGELTQVLIVSASTVFLVVAYFATYTFVTPILAGVGLHGRQQSITLLGFGVLGLLGIIITSRACDRWPHRTPAIQGAATAAAFAAATMLHGKVGTIVWLSLLAIAYSGLAVSWQSLVLTIAPAWADAASAVYVIAFQIGIAGGPILGAATRDGGQGVTYVASLLLALIATAAIAVLSRSGREPNDNAGRIVQTDDLVGDVQNR